MGPTFSTSRRFEVDSLFGGNLADEQKYMRLSREPRKYRGILKWVRELTFGGRRDVIDRICALYAALAPSNRFAARLYLYSIARGEIVAFACWSTVHRFEALLPKPGR